MSARVICRKCGRVNASMVWTATVEDVARRRCKFCGTEPLGKIKRKRKSRRAEMAAARIHNALGQKFQKQWSKISGPYTQRLIIDAIKGKIG